MNAEGGSERLSEDQARDRVAELWAEWVSWTGRASEGAWTPTPGSRLAAEDAAATGGEVRLSQYARTSLGIGSEHLVVAAGWCLNFGPPVFAAKTLLRTAVIGGAQAVFLLGAEDSAERLARAGELSRDSYWNQQRWVEGMANADPTVVDPSELEEVHEALGPLAGAARRRPERPTSAIIRDAVNRCFAQPRARQELMAEWQLMSGVAHALPWELNTRADFHDGLVGDGTRSFVATWSGLQGAFGLAHGLLQIGWHLLDEQATPTA